MMQVSIKVLNCDRGLMFFIAWSFGEYLEPQNTGRKAIKVKQSALSPIKMVGKLENPLSHA